MAKQRFMKPPVALEKSAGGPSMLLMSSYLCAIRNQAYLGGRLLKFLNLLLNFGILVILSVLSEKSGRDRRIHMIDEMKKGPANKAEVDPGRTAPI